MGSMDSRVIAIPVATAEYILGSAETALREGARLVLGSPARSLPILRQKFRGQRNVYCQQFDWNSAEQLTAFFDKAHARFHRLDTIVVGEEIWQSESPGAEKAMSWGIRALLQCLDASLRHVGEELHVIVASPNQYCEMAMSTASIFLRVKFQPQNATSCPTIRMTAVSTTGTKMVPAGPPALVRTLVQRYSLDDQPRAQSTPLDCHIFAQ